MHCMRTKMNSQEIFNIKDIKNIIIEYKIIFETIEKFKYCEIYIKSISYNLTKKYPRISIRDNTVYQLTYHNQLFITNYENNNEYFL